ncbi:alpha/beta hydrolase [Polycladidibacter hongkongensis]|uniref:alpha/beta hydrolase n=1 Tax=Polycladidibacter hongkongensis TaxID=1647556 RepID=UPI001AD8D700|nr:alpha/beta hydrolase [Pseudovibrio hongkongensis]
MKIRLLVVISLILCAACARAWAADAFRPYKDALFAYPEIRALSNSGAFLEVGYDIQRDLRDRDAIDEKRVHGEYVSLRPNWAQRRVTLPFSGGRSEHLRIGDVERTTKALIVYLHGKGGNAAQGMNDYSFGGNFNRLKNLSYRNDVVYASLSLIDFDDVGAAQVLDLIAYYRQGRPALRVVLACGSMGSLVCYRLAKDEESAELLDGLVMLGGAIDPTFADSAAAARRVPVFFAHGSADRAYSAASQVSAFESLLEQQPDYPARFVLFHSGSHGTPIRMIDWRLSLNWLFTRFPKR